MAADNSPELDAKIKALWEARTTELDNFADDVWHYVTHTVEKNWMGSSDAFDKWTLRAAVDEATRIYMRRVAETRLATEAAEAALIAAHESANSNRPS